MGVLRRPLGGWRVAAGIVGLLGVGVMLLVAGQVVTPPLGMKASYWASASTSGGVERSTDFAWLTDATRIDPALDLRGEGFGVYFFNDASRFNFGADVRPGRDQLPFSVRWDGWLLAPSDGARRLVVQSTGPARVWLDERVLGSADETLDLRAGLHQLRVEYTRPEARVPALSLQWQRTPGGELETVGGADVRWRPDAGSPMLGTALGGLGWLLIAAAAVAGIALAGRRLVGGGRAEVGSGDGPLRGPAHEAERSSGQARAGRAEGWWRLGLVLLPLAFLGYGVLVDAPLAGRASILSGLDDWLIYESSARDILLNGLLMNGGQGHAAPFYGQPLYPYVLALMHRLTGESLFGPIVLQFAALGAVVVGTAVLARRAFGARVDGLAALAMLLVLLQLEPEHFKIARQLFNENLYMPLVVASLVVVVSLARRRGPARWWQAVLAGVLLGVTTISRSQFLAFVPFAMLILWLAWRREARALGVTLLIGVGVLLAVAPVTARNWAVSGQFVPISSSGGASLLEFHRPPAGLIDQASIEKDPLFNALHLDQQTRTVVAFARADPLGYLATWLPLGAHSLGLQGRNDPGVYWPLLLTVLVYVASFGLRRVRRLHVWPIHAFVGTHLLILMLFEADTYGYRLVMPMYAPMVAVAAQVPLEVVRRVMRSRAGGALRSGDRARAVRFAAAGWAALAVAALAWQVGSLAPGWQDRDAALHGLGSAAAHAALTSDRAGADAIYVASVDGTPRRFGAGNLPGLRYPWIKWFDPLRSLPLPPSGATAVYMLSELRGQPSGPGDLTACLGAPDASAEVVVDADRARQACAAAVLAEAPLGATFDGVARIDAVRAPATAAAGETLDTRLVWQPLVPHPEAEQVSLQLDDPSAGDGTQWGNGTLELYPAQEWQPDESLVSRLPVDTDATALPQAYRLSVGMGPPKANAAPAMATWQGGRTDRVPVGSVVLTPGSSDAVLPADMRRLEGPGLSGGGLELIAARALPPSAAVGAPLRVGLLWRAASDAPSATQVRLRLVGGNGEVLQETALPLLGGRVAPSTLRTGNVVRDEQTFVVDPRVAAGQVSVEVALEDASLRLGSLELTGRAHAPDTSGSAALATFGGAMELLSAMVEPAAVHAGDKVTVRLRWRAAAPMQAGYKVFVHVLDAAGEKVVAQRDAEPLDGAAPTTSWVVGEGLDDSYQLVLPGGVAAGEYPVEVGVYEPRSGERLRLGNGENRLVLGGKVRVQ